uniref:Uncharacterized protein n=1 Tax=Cannabis sativa TaxID=3483 RepID=A0A803RA37_CANSA
MDLESLPVFKVFKPFILQCSFFTSQMFSFTNPPPIVITFSLIFWLLSFLFNNFNFVFYYSIMGHKIN